MCIIQNIVYILRGIPKFITEIIKRKYFILTKNNYVCSFHFISLDFKKETSDFNKSHSDNSLENIPK